MIAATLEYCLLEELFVFLFRRYGIEVKVLKIMRKFGRSGVPWVYFEVCGTGERRATMISFAEIRQVFLHYICTLNILKMSLDLQRSIGRTIHKIIKPGDIVNRITDNKTGIVRNRNTFLNGNLGIFVNYGDYSISEDPHLLQICY